MLFTKISVEDILPQLFAWLNTQSKSTYVYKEIRNQHKYLYENATIQTEYRYSIIVQGPVHNEKELTLNVLLDFLTSTEASQVILSTWSSEDTTNIEKKLAPYLSTQKLRVIKSPKPKNNGISNINLQICSMKKGFATLDFEETKFVLKVRSDQRFIESDICTKLEQAFNHYREGDSTSQILIVSRNTFIYRNYGASDFLQFGYFKAIYTYWDVAYDNRIQDDLRYPQPKNMLEESANSVCEIYLTRNYLNQIGFKIDDTLSNSLKAYAEVFIVVDACRIGLVWTKYSFDADPRKFLPEDSPFLELTQKRWLHLREHGLNTFNNPKIQSVFNR